MQITPFRWKGSFSLLSRTTARVVPFTLFGGKGLRYLVGPRLGLYCLPNAVALARFTGVFIFCPPIMYDLKILFLQRFKDFGFVYLFAIYKHQSV